jgi:hypothetical protein
MDERLKQILEDVTEELIHMDDQEFFALLENSKQSDLYKILHHAHEKSPRRQEWTANVQFQPSSPKRLAEPPDGGYEVYGAGYHSDRTNRDFSKTEGPCIAPMAA